MTLGYLLDPGDVCEATDERTFHVNRLEGECSYAPVLSGNPRPKIGSSGGIVTTNHAHVFRPWTKPSGPNPDLDAEKAAHEVTKTALTAIHKANEGLGLENLKLKTQNEMYQQMFQQLRQPMTGSLSSIPSPPFSLLPAQTETVFTSDDVALPLEHSIPPVLVEHEETAPVVSPEPLKAIQPVHPSDFRGSLYEIAEYAAGYVPPAPEPSEPSQPTP